MFEFELILAQFLVVVVLFFGILGMDRRCMVVVSQRFDNGLLLVGLFLLLQHAQFQESNDQFGFQQFIPQGLIFLPQFLTGNGQVLPNHVLLGPIQR